MLIYGCVTVLFLCVFALGIYLMRGRILIANRFLFLLSILILSVKVIQFAYYAATGNITHYPVEFSTLTCIVLPIVVFADKKHVAYPFVTYAAFMSGVLFNLFFFIGQDTFISLRKSELWLLLNLLIHDALLFCSLIMMGNFKFDRKIAWQLPLGSAIFVGWAFIAKYLIGYDSEIYTVRILEATIFDNVWNPEVNVWTTTHPDWAASDAFLPIYYVVMGVLIIASFYVVYELNKYIYKYDRVDEYYLDKEEY